MKPTVLGIVIFLFTYLALSQKENDDCKGYFARNVVKTDTTISADLDLVGNGCDVYSPSIPHLTLLAEYQTGMPRG